MHLHSIAPYPCLVMLSLSNQATQLWVLHHIPRSHSKFMCDDRAQMRSANCAAEAAATGQEQHGRFTYTFNSATNTWTHPSIDPAIVAAALAAKAAPANLASTSASTAIPITHSAPPQHPPRQHRTFTYDFDAASNTWTHPAMDPAAVRMAATAPAAAPADTMLGQSQITHDPRPLLQTRASLVSHTYTFTFKAAGDTWTSTLPTSADMTASIVTTPPSPAASDASGSCMSSVLATAATPSSESKPLLLPAAGASAPGKGQWSQVSGSALDAYIILAQSLAVHSAF